MEKIDTIEEQHHKRIDWEDLESATKIFPSQGTYGLYD